MESDCDLILPCRDEGPALRDLLPRVSAGIDVVVVDNGSRDDTATVAASLGARVVTEDVPGYGAAVHAGLVAGTRTHVAFMDGDGSFDPADLAPLLDDIRSGRADLAVGRRRPVSRGAWPWHARLGNPGGGVAAATPRVCRAGPVEGLGVGRRHRPDRPRLLAGARMIGMAAAADDAAAALLDTLHADLGLALGALPVVQIGMDTPQVTGDLLESACRQLAGSDAVLGDADDGGWWLLGLRDRDRDVDVEDEDEDAVVAATPNGLLAAAWAATGVQVR